MCNNIKLFMTEIIITGFILICTIFVLIKIFPGLILGSIYIVGFIGVIILLLTVILSIGLSG